MPVSIKAILLSGTAALPATGVAAGAGVGVGVGVGLGGVVGGRVWATTETAVMATRIRAAKIKRILFIAFPPG
jgi:hypothetical protein